MNASEENGLDEARAARVWEAFQTQLASGSVVFQENGAIQFAMPFTHRLALFLPAAVCDTIEAVFSKVRGEYVGRVPRKVRRRLETRLNYAADSGWLAGALVMLLALLLVDISRSAFASGATATVPPTDKGKKKKKGE